MLGDGLEVKYFSSNDSLILAQSKISSPVHTESILTISKKDGAKRSAAAQSPSKKGKYGLS